MTTVELWETCLESFVLLSRDGDRIKADPLFPETHPIPVELVSLLRQHKQELLRLIDYQIEADALLLESTRRLAARWPAGYVLDGLDWDCHESALHEAYWTLCRDRLSEALQSREKYAFDAFDRHGKEHEG